MIVEASVVDDEGQDQEMRPVFLPFDPAAGEKKSPPVIEVGKFRTLRSARTLHTADLTKCTNTKLRTAARC
jgi:hypothetical protein